MSVGWIPETSDIQGVKPQLLSVPQLFIYTRWTKTETSPCNSWARAPSPHLVPACGHIHMGAHISSHAS